MPRPGAPLLVERSLLLVGDTPDMDAVEHLVAFQRSGRRTLLIAPRPRRWRPTLSTVDRDLSTQQTVHRLFSRAGAELDGVYYLSARLFSPRQAGKDELEDIARRYEVKVRDLVLIGADPELLESFVSAGARALSVSGEGPQGCEPCLSLEQALARVGTRV